jgi:hypothetical protein
MNIGSVVPVTDDPVKQHDRWSAGLELIKLRAREAPGRISG